MRAPPRRSYNQWLGEVTSTHLAVWEDHLDGSVRELDLLESIGEVPLDLPPFLGVASRLGRRNKYEEGVLLVDHLPVWEVIELGAVRVRDVRGLSIRIEVHDPPVDAGLLHVAVGEDHGLNSVRQDFLPGASRVHNLRGERAPAVRRQACRVTKPKAAAALEATQAQNQSDRRPTWVRPEGKVRSVLPSGCMASCDGGSVPGSSSTTRK